MKPFCLPIADPTTTLSWENLPRVSPLLSNLFHQQRLIGLLCGSLGTAAKSFEGFSEGLRKEHGGLRTLSTIASHLDDGNSGLAPGIPVLYNSARWSEPELTCGLSEPGSRVTLDEILISYYGIWNLGIESPETLAQKLIRGALFQARKNADLTTGFSTIFDLANAGYANSLPGFLSAFRTLAKIYLHHPDPDRRVAEGDFPRVEPATSEREWLAKSKGFDKLLKALKSAARGQPSKPEAAGNLFILLLDRLEAASQVVRRSTGAAGFLVGQAMVRFLTEALALMRREWPDYFRTSIARESAYSQAEELRADCGAISSMFLASNRFGLPTHELAPLTAAWFVFHHNYGVDWAEMLSRQRLLIPHHLKTNAAEYVASERDRSHIPREWLEYPPELVSAVCACLDIPRAWQRRPRFSVDKFEGLDSWRELLETLNLDRDQSIYLLDSEYASGYSKRPSNEISDTAREAFRDALRPMHNQLVGGEIRQLQQLAESFSDIPDSRWPALLEKLYSFRDRYPWSSPVRLELGIRLDQLNRPKEAAVELETGIQLEAGNPLLWHSIGTVYRRLGLMEDAKFSWLAMSVIKESAPGEDQEQ